MLPPTWGLIRTPGVRHSGWSAGSGSGSVTSRAARSTAGRALGQKGVGVDHRAARDVHQQGTVTHPGQEVRVDHPAGVGCQGHDQDHHVHIRQQAGQLVDRADVDPVHHPGGAGHRTHLALEPVQAARDGPSDRPEPDDQHSLVSQGLVPVVEPATIGHGAGEVVEVAQARDRQADGQFGRRGVVNAGGVAQRDPVGQFGEHVVDARGQGLHDPQVRHPGHHGQVPRGGRVRRDEHLDVRQPGRVGLTGVPGDAPWSHFLGQALEDVAGEQRRHVSVAPTDRGPA